MDYQQTCIQKQKHLTNIYFYQNLRQLYIMAPITTVRDPFQSIPKLSAKILLSVSESATEQLLQEIKFHSNEILNESYKLPL